MLEVANVETQLSELYVGITYYRLRKEIEYLIRVVNEKRPQYPSANDGFFSQLKMKGSNAFNKGEFEKCSKLLEIAKAYLNDFSKKNEKYSYCFNWTRERIYELVRKIREQSNNTFLPLVEYATDIILDRSLEYRNNKEFFGDMSWIFFNNPTEFDLINKDISENYVKILNDEVDRLKGIKTKEEIKEEEKPLIEVENHIKDEYTSDESLKIELHKKINEIDSYEKLDEVRREIEDRFGKIDSEMDVYMYSELFEKQAKELNINTVNQTNLYVELVLENELINKIPVDKLFMEANDISTRFKFEYKNDRLYIKLMTNGLDKHFVYYLTELLSKIKDMIV